jgi:hypothetical protein
MCSDKFQVTFVNKEIIIDIVFRQKDSCLLNMREDIIKSGINNYCVLVKYPLSLFPIIVPTFEGLPSPRHLMIPCSCPYETEQIISPPFVLRIAETDLT